MRYCFRMTDFEPLAYGASLMVFAMVVAYVAAMQWSPVFRRVTWHYLCIAMGVPVGVAMWLAGPGVWIGLGIGAYLLYVAWGLADLWSQPLARRIEPWLDRIGSYASWRRYRPIHAR